MAQGIVAVAREVWPSNGAGGRKKKRDGPV